MENGSIQLPFGFVPDKNSGGEIQFNLPLNYKKDLLFRKLPFITNLNDPAIDDVIKNGNVDKSSRYWTFGRFHTRKFGNDSN